MPPDSPLAEAAGHVLPQRAGPERSVAATKSFICSLVCVARLIALWRRDRTLAAALERLPERLEAALACDWSAALPLLAPAHSLYVVGRGLGFGIVHEWALKLKETSGLHAEALSAAEVQHGPRAVIERGFPVLALALDRPGGPGRGAPSPPSLPRAATRSRWRARRRSRAIICRCRRRSTPCSIRSSRCRPSIRWRRRSPQRAVSIRTGRAGCAR